MEPIVFDEFLFTSYEFDFFKQLKLVVLELREGARAAAAEPEAGKCDEILLRNVRSLLYFKCFVSFLMESGN